MRYRTLGSSGLLVSVVGLGCNNFGGRLDPAATQAVIDAAFDEGITLLDTSDIYGNAGGSEEADGPRPAMPARQDRARDQVGPASADLGHGPAAGAKGGRS